MPDFGSVRRTERAITFLADSDDGDNDNDDGSNDNDDGDSNNNDDDDGNDNDNGNAKNDDDDADDDDNVDDPRHLAESRKPGKSPAHPVAE